ncbi:MAG: ROK family protein [Lacunisphaera sp.]|nr:ROK family protein [Lacunisphaera sp.]
MALHVRHVPALDPEFLPAVLWNRGYRELVAQDKGARPIALALLRADGTGSVHEDRVLSREHPAAGSTLRYVERLLKFLLWQRGACSVLVAGAEGIAVALKEIYSPAGARHFDHHFMGRTVCGQEFSVSACSWDQLPVPAESNSSLGRHLDGCRIGFDLGGSDRKAAAIIDGQVVFSEEIAWDPYFQKDPQYHIGGVHDSIARAAAHLPRIDAIGGSAAGVYVSNEVRVASLFRGVPAEEFARHIRRMFFDLQARFGGVPFAVANDGEVTALAGSMSLDSGAVLGISMGTSVAGGYVTPAGTITPWLNELAFAPVDYRENAPLDEWSGDAGCGVQYFCQQGVNRLALRAGFVFPAALPLAERLGEVQQAMQSGDPRARAVYETIGTCFGYSIAHYAEFYDHRHLLVLGRVSSGAGGDLILATAAALLQDEFPALAGKISLHMPDEQKKRHGQAIAAASLPALRPPT